MQCRPRIRLDLEQDGSPQRPCLAEERGKGSAELIGPERLVLEERQLPAIERLGKRAVGIGEGEAHEQLAGERATEGVEARRIAGRLGGGDREHRPDPEWATIERLEENRAGREWRSRGKPDRADRICDLCRSVGRLLGTRQRRTKLEHAVAIGLAAEVLRHQRAGFGPVTGELAVRHRSHAQTRRELELCRHRETDERSDGGVCSPLPEERALELGVGAVERLVVPVESSARLGRGDEQTE